MVVIMTIVNLHYGNILPSSISFCVKEVIARSPFQTIICKEVVAVLETTSFSNVPSVLVDTLAGYFTGIGTSKPCEDVMQRLNGICRAGNSNGKMAVPRRWVEATKTDVLGTFGMASVNTPGSSFDRTILPAKAPETLFQHRKDTNTKFPLPFDDVTRCFLHYYSKSSVM